MNVQRSFVELVSSHDWSKPITLTEEEIELLGCIVELAGFEIKGIVPGKLHGNYRDQGGDDTGERFLVNHTCPYKVIGTNGLDFYNATGWLDCILNMVIANIATENKALAIENLQKEITRSIPLPAIPLTIQNDLLNEFPPTNHGYLKDHTRDHHPLSDIAGIHDICNGSIDLKQTSMTHSALFCRACGLRVVFPNTIKTYGDLRLHFADARV